MRPLLAPVALLLAGCAGTSAPQAPPDPWEGPPVAEAPRDGFRRTERIVAARLRVVLPPARAPALVRGLWGGMPAARLPEDRAAGLPSLLLVARERDGLTVEVAGEDLAILAEGGVEVWSESPGCGVGKGPFRTLVWRNGEELGR